MVSQRLLRRSLAVLVVGAATVAFCYFFVDRPVARFVHAHVIPAQSVLRWATYAEPVLLTLAPTIVAGLAVIRVRGPWSRSQSAWMAAALAVLVGNGVAEAVKPLGGRYWPATWVDNNPSLIGDGAYGFHPFHDGSWYGSFPSGHTTIAFAAAAVMWTAWPKGRPLYAILSLFVPIGLVANNYHFVGDTIAGGVLGSLCGIWTAALMLPAPLADSP